jgi:hypothetical protein
MITLAFYILNEKIVIPVFSYFVGTVSYCGSSMCWTSTEAESRNEKVPLLKF